MVLRSTVLWLLLLLLVLLLLKLLLVWLLGWLVLGRRLLLLVVELLGSWGGRPVGVVGVEGLALAEGMVLGVVGHDGSSSSRIEGLDEELSSDHTRDGGLWIGESGVTRARERIGVAGGGVNGWKL